MQSIKKSDKKVRVVLISCVIDINKHNINAYSKHRKTNY